MVDLEEIVEKHKDGAILNIFVTVNASENSFPAGFNRWRKSLEMKVKSPAKDNKANKEIINTVSDYFEKPLHDVYIISGEKNREKKILIKNTSCSFIKDCLRDSLDGL